MSTTRTERRSIATTANYRYIRRLGPETYGLNAPAKLNITLEIGEKDAIGYHHIRSVMQTVDLCDRVTFSPKSTGSILVLHTKTNSENIEDIEDNIIFKAMTVLSANLKSSLPCTITLEKNIPIGAGMGGGSSDAAAVLMLANHAFRLNMSDSDLRHVASMVGNDVSFLLRGGRALVEGIKDHTIDPIGGKSLFYLLGIVDGIELSTKTMYRLFDEKRDELLSFGYKNQFTRLACELSPITARALASLDDYGPVEHGLSGKGPTVFAGYSTYAECVDAKNELLVSVPRGITTHIVRSVGPLID